MVFPKDEAFSVLVDDLETATRMATSHHCFGGCFEQVADGFVVYWLPKDHALRSEFAW